MIDYRFLEHQISQKIGKLSFPLIKVISLIISLFFSFFQIIKRDSYFRQFILQYNHKFIIKRYLLFFRNHYFNILFILIYGQQVYGEKRQINKTFKNIKYRNFEYCEQVLATEKPLIIFTSHIGSLFVPLFQDKIIPLIKRDIISLAPLDNQIRKFLITDKINQFLQVSFDYIDLSSWNDRIMTAYNLKAGKILICTLDAVYPQTKNMPVRFMDTITNRPVGIIQLGMRYDSMFLPLFTYLEKGQFVIEFGRPFSLPGSYKNENDIHSNLKSITHLIESQIIKRPAQWMMWSAFFQNKKNVFLNQSYDQQKEFYFYPFYNLKYWKPVWIKKLIDSLGVDHKGNNNKIRFNRLIFIDKKRKAEVKIWLECPVTKTFFQYNNDLYIFTKNINKITTYIVKR